MADRFEKFPALLEGLARDGFDITPNDSTDFSQPTRALWVGGDGDVKVDLVGYDGTPKTLTFKGAAAGSLLPFRIQRVYATGTTATDLIGVY